MKKKSDLTFLGFPIYFTFSILGALAALIILYLPYHFFQKITNHNYPKYEVFFGYNIYEPLSKNDILSAIDVNETNPLITKELLIFDDANIENSVVLINNKVEIKNTYKFYAELIDDSTPVAFHLKFDKYVSFEYCVKYSLSFLNEIKKKYNVHNLSIKTHGDYYYVTGLNNHEIIVASYCKNNNLYISLLNKTIYLNNKEYLNSIVENDLLDVKEFL